jgi:hypothetical protein
VFYNHPDVFGKHVSYGDDNVLNSYILHHINLGPKSKHFEMI